MKSKKPTWFPMIILFAALMAPMQLAAQQHHHYKLIDLGTFGASSWTFPRAYIAQADSCS